MSGLRPPRAVVVLGLVLLGLAPSAFAQKELTWDEMAVTGRLDADGRLHVVERQAIRFNGDWNGAERIFRLGLDQWLDFEGQIVGLDCAVTRNPSLRP